jgi:tetratricopeptide (TPR) repeat protein
LAQLNIHPSALTPARSERWLVWVVILLAVASMSPILTADFVQWDDHHTIVGNRAFNPPTVESFFGHWRQQFMHLYQPLTLSVWHLLAVLVYREQPDALGSHLDPWVFKFANVALHAVSSVLVLRILRRFNFAPTPAWLGAAVFAVHPIQVESVGWTSGLKDLLCVCLMLSAIRAWLVEQRRRRLLVTAAWMTAACLAKPTAMVLPAMLGLIELLHVRAGLIASIKRTSPLLVISVAVMAGTAYVQQAAGVDRVALHLRPIVALDAIGFYISKLLLPINLAFNYGRDPHAVFDGRLWLWSLPVALVALAGMAWLARRDRRWALGTLLALVPITPVLGLVPFDYQQYSTVGDHYLYPAMLGVAVLVATVVDRAGRRAWLIGAVLVVVFAGMSFRQALTWRDGREVELQTLRVNVESWGAHSNLAAWYQARGMIAEAEESAFRAMAINPEHPDVIFNMGAILVDRGRHEEALPLFVEAVKRKRTEVQMQLALAKCAEKLDKLPTARHAFRAALVLDPRNTVARAGIERIGAPDDGRPVPPIPD